MATDFENVFEELPDPIERWHDLDLQHSYKHIEPSSAIGSIAVALHETESNKRDEKRDIDRRYPSEVDHIVHEGDIKAADQAFELASARLGVLKAMYLEVQKALLKSTADPTTEDRYKTAVEDALKTGIEDLDKIRIPEGSKSELVLLNQELAAFMILESDLHFQEMV